MTDPGGWTDHDRYLIFLGQLKGSPDHVLGFLRAHRVENGDLRKMRKESAVLFRLRAVRSGIVGDDENQAALYAEVG